jgi:hypothetical protein
MPGEILGEVAKAMIEGIVEFVTYSTFHRDLDFVPRSTRVRVVADVCYVGMLASFSAGACLYLWGNGQHRMLVFWGAVFLAVLMIQNGIEMWKRASRRTSPIFVPRLRDNLNWMLPTLVSSLWTGALTYRTDEPVLWHALLAALTAFLLVTGFVCLQRKHLAEIGLTGQR